MTEKLLPEPLLVRIFEYAVWSSNDEPPCPLCRRPYYFLLDGPMARTIRLVSWRWRKAWTYYIIIKGMTAPDVPWCVSPSRDAERLADELRVREQVNKAPWLYRPFALAARTDE